MTTEAESTGGAGKRHDLAETFFERGRILARTGEFEQAIDLFIHGLSLSPNRIDAHCELRTIALERKVSGGMGVGIMQALRFNRRTSDHVRGMMNAERLLSYDPGNTDYMLRLLQESAKAGLSDVTTWIEAILQKATTVH
jgi:hypothetical protein